jgi:fucose 4-O-acetylase-like acetyltransferase
MITANEGRHGHIDALKGAGILLVVFGHLIEKPSAHSMLMQMVYIAIYSFHMPLFVFLSGIFARETLKGRDYQKIIWTLFLPLVVFQGVYLAVGWMTGWFSYSAFTPYWILWFIASMIGWRILLPLSASAIGLLVALSGAVLVGYDETIGYALSASRTIYFLPFFVLGHLYGLRLVETAKKHRLMFSCIFAATMLMVTLWWLHGLDGSALTGSRDYGSAPPSGSFPGIARLLLIGLALAALMGFSAIIPSKSAVLEWLGARSLSIYLLHGLAIMVLVSAGALDHIPQPLLLPALGVFAVFIAALAAPFDAPLRRIFSPPAASTNMDSLAAGWNRSR